MLSCIDYLLHPWEYISCRWYSKTDHNSPVLLTVRIFLSNCCCVLLYLRYWSLFQIHIFIFCIMEFVFGNIWVKLFLSYFDLVLSDLNYRHRNAQMASRSSVELHTLIYFRKRCASLYLFVCVSMKGEFRLIFGLWWFAGLRIQKQELLRSDQMVSLFLFPSACFLIGYMNSSYLTSIPLVLVA